jgi:hypothetical protein
MDIYKEMIDAGVQGISNHESDLYAPVNDTTRAIVARYPGGRTVKTFTNQATGALSYDIPCAYSPFWKKKT